MNGRIPVFQAGILPRSNTKEAYMTIQERIDRAVEAVRARTDSIRLPDIG